MSAVVPWFARLGVEQQQWTLRYLIAPGDAAKAHLPPLVPALIDGIRTAAAAPFSTGGWQDTWHDQLQLSLCAAAVLHSGLAALPTETRWLCFRVAAGLLTDFLRRRHGAPPADGRGIPALGPDAILAARPGGGGTPRNREHGRPVRLPVRALADIADALLAYPEILNDSTRHQIIGIMPAEIRGGVQYSAMPRLHVINLIRACADHPDGRGLLLDITEIVGGPEHRHHHLRDSVDRWWAG